MEEDTDLDLSNTPPNVKEIANFSSIALQINVFVSFSSLVRKIVYFLHLCCKRLFSSLY
jgi:hypothetical protein